MNIMKKLSYKVTALAFIITCFSELIANAQTAPQAFNYQAIARDISGNVLADQPVGLLISIPKTSPLGTVEYSEMHTVTTNQFGLFTLKIGNGTMVSGNFTTID